MENEKEISVVELVNELYFQELKASILFKIYAQNLRVSNLPHTAKVLEELSTDKFCTHLKRMEDFFDRIGADIKIIELNFNQVQIDGEDAIADVKKIFESVIENEEESREKILEIADFALEFSDHDAYDFIGWFVKDSLEDINELLGVYENICNCNSLLQVEMLLKK